MRLSGYFAVAVLVLAPAVSFGQQSFCDIDPSNCQPMEKPTPTQSVCKLSDLNCSSISNKCDIKFVNKTGVTENICEWSKSYAQAKTVNLTTQWRTGSKYDSSLEKFGKRRSIDAGKSLTIDVGKRIAEANQKLENGKLPEDGEFLLRVRPTDSKVDGVNLTCDQIRAILKANKTCKVYYKEINPSFSNSKFVLVDCGTKDLCWPKKWTSP